MCIRDSTKATYEEAIEGIKCGFCHSTHLFNAMTGFTHREPGAVSYTHLVRYSKNQDFSFIKEIIDGYSDALFIVTNNCGQYIKNIPDVNIIMLFADDMFYSYKKILYMLSLIHI